MDLEDVKQFGGPIAPADPARVADIQAVCQLCRVYTLGVDMRDYDLVRTVFSDDAFGDGQLGAFPIDEYLPKVYNGAAVYSATQHNITSQNVRVEGDEAVLFSHAIAYHIEEPGNGHEDLVMGVQYRDHCRRTPKGWLIARRKVKVMWVRGPLPRRQEG